MMRRSVARALVAFAVCVAIDVAGRAQTGGAALVGWATLPVETYADGPTSGQFAGAGQFGHALPLVDKQPVQGFSAVIAGPAPGTFYVTLDNGFGNKANSADALLRVYAVRPDFRTASGGSATVLPAAFTTGARLATFTPDSYITLHDPDRRLGFARVADAPTYPAAAPGRATNAPQAAIPVAASIATGRLLTGADLDPESFRKDASGHFWFGDEFGPFLIKTDLSGKVLRAEIPLEGVIAPENPYRGAQPPTIGSSKGFEGLALNRSGSRLYVLIEGTVSGDAPNTLRICEFDLATERYTGVAFRYALDPAGTNIGDMTAVDDHRYLVIERNGASGASGTQPPFKKIFLIDTAVRDAAGLVRKTELVDLMHVADPDDLNRDGSTTFTFPFVTIEDVLVIDARTLLVINDNNYPGGGGRGPMSDPTEFLLLRLPAPLTGG